MRYVQVLLAGALGLTACNSAQFSGNSRAVAPSPAAPPATPVTPAAPAPAATPAPPAPATTAAPVPPGVQALTSTCQATTVSAQTGGQAILSGQLCPQATGSAAILFVVDYSGSMGLHRNVAANGAYDWAAGSDPLTNGTCGRLQAAQAVLASVQQAVQAGGQASVQIGFVPFASDVLEDRVIPLTSLANFQASVTAQTFCSYVVQEAADLGSTNPAGIQDGQIIASTNYAAAFSGAATVLSGVSDAVIYFISDGEPTAGGSDPVAAGVQAGQQLLAGHPGVTLNGLLLGSDGAQAQTTLTDVVGSASRVRLAAQASQLAQQIVQFPAVAFAPGTQTATLTVGNGAAVPLALQSFGPQAGTGAANVWSFETIAFSVATAGTQTITVAAKTNGGQTVTSTTTVTVGGGG